MKNSDVLKILYENKGEFVSGEEMASKFNISRAALSKRIAKLKDKGIEIDAVTNKGYKLKFLSNNICEENASLGILENQVIGNTIFALEEIDSTNEYDKKNRQKIIKQVQLLLQICRQAVREEEAEVLFLNTEDYISA